MTDRPMTLRHCPLCGVAMQSRREFRAAQSVSLFECQTCHTTIEENAGDRQAGAPSRRHDTAAP